MRAFFLRKKQGSVALENSLSSIGFVMMLGVLISLSQFIYINQMVFAAAKEGARVASVEPDLAVTQTQAAAITDIRTRVKNFLSRSSNIQLADSDIAVTPPSGSNIGDRTVNVRINYRYNSPVKIQTFLDHMNGGDANNLDVFTIAGNVTMRYEE